jgi:hypothetical protein
MRMANCCHVLEFTLLATTAVNVSLELAPDIERTHATVRLDSNIVAGLDELALWQSHRVLLYDLFGERLGYGF